eukprot:g2787.t1
MTAIRTLQKVLGLLLRSQGSSSENFHISRRDIVEAARPVKQKLGKEWDSDVRKQFNDVLHAVPAKAQPASGDNAEVPKLVSEMRSAISNCTPDYLSLWAELPAGLKVYEACASPRKAEMKKKGVPTLYTAFKGFKDCVYNVERREVRYIV